MKNCDFPWLCERLPEGRLIDQMETWNMFEHPVFIRILSILQDDYILLCLRITPYTQSYQSTVVSCHTQLKIMSKSRVHRLSRL